MPPHKQRKSGLRVVTRSGTDNLYLRGTVRGEHVYESTGTSDPQIAEEARARRETELHRAAIFGVAPTVTFDAAALAYLKHEERPVSTGVNIAKLLKHFGPKVGCDKITQAEIDKAAAAICPNAKPQSRLRQVITPAKAILNFAARRGWCAAPHFEPVKSGGKRTDWLTPREAEAQISAASGHFAPLLIFAYCTGARMNEIIDLEWQDIDLMHGRAVLRDTKNGDDRIVDLMPRAVAALANLTGKRKGQVFRKPGGEPYRPTDDTKAGASGGQVKRAWASSLEGANITRHLTPHHARHSWATWHYCLHRDLVRLREDGGWRTVAMVERYAKLAPEAMRQEVEIFWGTKSAKSVQRARKLNATG